MENLMSVNIIQLLIKRWNFSHVISLFNDGQTKIKDFGQTFKTIPALHDLLWLSLICPYITITHLSLPPYAG